MEIKVSTTRCPLCAVKFSEQDIDKFTAEFHDSTYRTNAHYQAYVSLLATRRPGKSVPVCIWCWDWNDQCHTCRFPFFIQNVLVTKLSGAIRNSSDCRDCKRAREPDE